MAYVAPGAPQSIGGILDDWLRLFRETFRSCWVLALIGALANAYQEFRLIPRLPASSQSLEHYFAQLGTAYRAPDVFLTDLVFWLLLLVLYGALVVQQLTVVRGGQPGSIGAALSASLSRLPQMLLGVVLLVLIEGGLGGVIGFSSLVLIPLHRSPALAAGIGLLILALVVVILYVSVRVQFWLVALFDADCGAASAIGRSWRLVKDHWWHTTGIMFVAGIVIWILGLAVGVIAGVLASWFTVTGGALGAVSHLRVIAAVAALARVLSMPLLTAAWLAIYHDLKLRREGADLAARAEALGGG